MPAPVVLAHVAERGGDAALRRHGMAAGREHLGDAGGLEAGLGEAKGRAQAGDAEIGRASCRERVCPYVELSVVAVSLKKTNNNDETQTDTTTARNETHHKDT